MMTISTSTNPGRRHRRRRWALLLVLLVLLAVGLYPVVRYGWVNYQYRAAVAANERRDFSTARLHLDACLREWPNSAETHFLAARTARRAGDLEAAARLLREAQRLGWVREAIDLERALIQVHQGSYRQVARPLINFVMRRHPDSLIILEALTPALAHAFELGLAAQCIGLWVLLEPQNPTPHYLMGELLMLVSPSDAGAHFAEVVRRDPNHVEAREYLALVQLRNKEFFAAVEHYQWLVERKPNSRVAVLGLAECLNDLGRESEAQLLIDRLLAADPGDPDALTLRGMHLIAAGRPVEAEQLLRRALARQPYDLRLLYNLALCLEQNEQPVEASRLRERALQVEEEHKATELLIKEIGSNPTDAERRRQVGVRLLKMNEVEEGRRWIMSALRANPTHRASYESLADYYLTTGDAAAAEEYRRIAQALPESHWWRPDRP